MSVGSWILFVSGSASGLAAALRATGWLPRLELAAEATCATFGAPLSTYTATLLSDTAIPVWHEGRRELPFVFAGGAASSAGAAATALLPPSDAGPARRLALAGAGLKTAAVKVMERRLGFVGEPYRQGAAGLLTRASKACTLAGAAALGLGGRRSRTAAVVGSSLLLAGDLLLRWGVFRAGFQSARDPRYTVQPQRERLAA